MKVSPVKLSILLLISSLVHAGQSQEGFLSNFVSGKYHLLGKHPDSNETYYGKVELVAVKDNIIKVERTIAGRKTNGTGSIKEATPDKIHVLHILFNDNDQQHEHTCMIGSDLDNYARLTCYTYIKGSTAKEPGLEALFIDHD